MCRYAMRLLWDAAAAAAAQTKQIINYSAIHQTCTYLKKHLQWSTMKAQKLEKSAP